jgi:hypothetical protein
LGIFNSALRLVHRFVRQPLLADTEIARVVCGRNSKVVEFQAGLSKDAYQIILGNTKLPVAVQRKRYTSLLQDTTETLKIQGGERPHCARALKAQQAACAYTDMLVQHEGVELPFNP